MKEFDGIAGIWTYNDIPEKDEFVLIANVPFQDNAKEAGRSKNKNELIKKGERMRSRMYSSLRIYNEKKTDCLGCIFTNNISSKRGRIRSGIFGKTKGTRKSKIIILGAVFQLIFLCQYIT